MKVMISTAIHGFHALCLQFAVRCHLSLSKIFVCESLVGNLINSIETANTLPVLGETLLLVAKCECPDCVLAEVVGVGPSIQRGRDAVSHACILSRQGAFHVLHVVEENSFPRKRRANQHGQEEIISFP